MAWRLAGGGWRWCGLAARVLLRSLVFFLASPVVLLADLIQPDPHLERGWVLGFMGLLTATIILTWGFGYLVTAQALEGNALVAGYAQMSPDLSHIPYHEQIQTAAAESGVDPALIAAIISQESGFDPEAVSPAGARGLMQILPSTWRLLCPHSSCPGLHQPPSCGPDCIFNPTANIQAGTRFFAGLLDQFDGNVVLAFAAYNAGSAAVRRYAGPDSIPAAGTAADGLESLPPFPETRLYVRRVLDFWIGLRGGGSSDAILLSAEESRLMRQLATTLPLFVLGLWTLFGAWVLRRVVRRRVA